ncbi:MAG: HTH domain-containing protein [Deltaproteobacteria bacterium]|nr:HTH domain-containing protein [Deltaproteobacteria bacterium]
MCSDDNPTGAKKQGKIWSDINLNPCPIKDIYGLCFLAFYCKKQYIAFMDSYRCKVIMEYLRSINDFVSGRELGKIAHCSPQNVSYHISMLRKSGADIKVSRKGYRYNREAETELSELKKKFVSRGISFEYIRSCLNLKNVGLPGGKNGNLYYTYNEADFFCKHAFCNLSFITDICPSTGVLPLVCSFFSEYLEGQMRRQQAGDGEYLFFEDYMFCRYIRYGYKEHFQIVINDSNGCTFDGYKVISLSNVRGDYIGIRGFSVLIFSHLYANLPAD